MAKRTLGPGQPEPPPWPAAPDGWHWCRKGCPCQLEAPDGWKTKNYNYPERALAEAQRRIVSTPKPKEQAMTAATISVEQAIERLRRAKYTVKPHGARYLVGATSADAQVMSVDEVVNFAATQAWIAGDEAPAGWTAICGSCGQSFISDVPVTDGATCSSCSQEAAAPAVASDGSMRLMDLMTALEAHAKRIAKLPAGQAIPLPAGLPDRLLVPIALVVSGRYQPRTVFVDTALGELADSIREHGILRAPIVFANEHAKIELIGGERRIRAARLAGLTMVPVEFRSYSMAQIAEISGLDNFHAAELSPVEKGAYFNRLMAELGMSENALAKRLGLPRTHIQQCRSVASGAPELHKAIAEGQLTFSHARAIAQSAPGDHKAQKQALTLLAERVRSGRTVTEAEAKAETEKLVRKRLENDLKKLGWLISGYGEIWAPSERPKTWTGAEMLEAVKNQRRPSSTQIEDQVSAADLQALQWQHDQVSRLCAPWIGLRKSFSGPWSYVAPSEVRALAQEIRDAVSALQARVAPHGFTIEPSKGTYIRFNVKGKHSSQAHYSWAALEGCVAQIEAGEVVDRPREQQAVSAPARQQSGLKCDGCKKATGGGLMYCGRYGSLCEVCRVPALEQQKAEREAREAAAQAARQKANNAIGAWLRSAPAGAVPLLYAALVGEGLDEDITVDGVLDAVGSYLNDLELEADDDEPLEQYAPTVAKLLAGDASNGNGKFAEAIGLVEQAAALIRQDTAEQQAAEPQHQVDAEPLLLGDIPADSPLAPIEAAVINIHQWYRISGAHASDEEIEVNRKELRAISDDMDALSDDETVSDDQFELLTTAIGKLAEALRELREEREVAA